MADGAPPQTAAEQLRRKQLEALVQSALVKKKAGTKLLAKEISALEKWEQLQDERRGLRFVHAVPKKYWVAWSGRQQRTLNAQADLYGLPVGGATIDVPALAKWLHDWLATHKQALSELVAVEDLPEGEAKTLQGKLLAEKVAQLKHRNLLLQSQLAEKQQQLLPRDQVHELLVRAAQLLRSAGDRLYKQHGQEAGDILAHALDDFDELLNQLPDADGSSQQTMELDTTQ